MRQSQIVLGITVLALGILSAVPGIRATEPSEVEANGNTTGDPFVPDEGTRLSLPLQISKRQNLSLGAVTQSGAGEPYRHLVGARQNCAYSK